jgi:hypothetical protein
MFRTLGIAALACAVLAATPAAQDKTAADGKTAGKAAAAKGTKYDVKVTADQVYSGTMTMAVEKGKVSGEMLMTSPMEITGKVAGTSKDGELQLEFPYTITDSPCGGNVKMKIAMPEKPGPAKGTMEAVNCEGEKMPGTVEIAPAGAKKDVR